MAKIENDPATEPRDCKDPSCPWKERSRTLGAELAGTIGRLAKARNETTGADRQTEHAWDRFHQAERRAARAEAELALAVARARDDLDESRRFGSWQRLRADRITIAFEACCLQTREALDLADSRGERLGQLETMLAAFRKKEAERLALASASVSTRHQQGYTDLSPD